MIQVTSAASPSLSPCHPRRRTALLARGVAIAAVLLFSELPLDHLYARTPIVYEYGVGHSAAVNLNKDAEARLTKGDLDGALRSVNTALGGDPKFWPALYTRAKIHGAQHKLEAAMQDCNQLLVMYPYLVEASLFRARINAKLGHYAESFKEIDHVVSIRPNSDSLASALDLRAWLRLTCPDPAFRDAKQALKDAKTACNLILWGDEDMLDTLALACAQNGDFESAVKYEQKALKVKGISAEDSKQFQGRLALFQQGKGLMTSP